jgi:hypothetical protein
MYEDRFLLPRTDPDAAKNIPVTVGPPSVLLQRLVVLVIDERDLAFGERYGPHAELDLKQAKADRVEWRFLRSA